MISPKSLMKIATTASVVAMTVSVAVVPAYAMQDIEIEDTPSSFAATVDDAQNSSNSMPDNPNATLPETVSENISDDSTVVSENLAVTPEGDVQNIETGETVIERVSFEGKQLVMESGDLKQSVDYAIADGRLVLKTEFGTFSFPFEKTEEGIRIDGIEYIKD